MKLNLFSTKYKIVLLIFILPVLGIASYKIAKLVIVKEKWVRILSMPAPSQNPDRNTIKSGLTCQIANIFSHDTSNHYFGEVYGFNKHYEYNLFLKKTSNIQNVKIDIQYPDGFILKVNHKLCAVSPNLDYDSIANSLAIFIEHNNNENNTESFFFSGTSLTEGQNLIEIELISERKLKENYNPLLALDVYKTGFFISDFQTLERKSNIDMLPSQLPQIWINTSGQEVVDEPKIKATLALKSNKQNYKTNIKIELRGKSSQQHGQLNKSYSFNIFNNNWKRSELDLLELPKDNEWVLYAPYIGKSIIRNALVYDLAAEMGHYAPRYKFCDLYLNGVYRGVYMLVEKPKLSPNRINPYPKDSKAFLCKIDRPQPTGNGWYLFNENNEITYINILYPKTKDLASKDISELQTSINEINKTLSQQSTDTKRLDSLIDINSFIDYILINELAKNPDSYGLSVYFTKAGNKPIIIGPVWDFDIALGNTFDEQWKQASDWCLTDTANSIFKRIEWANAVFKNPNYANLLAKRWFSLRKTALSWSHINELIDKKVKELKNSEFNYHRTVPILNRWVWPNAYSGETYSNEIYYLKGWIMKRIYWMDKELAKFQLSS